MGNETPASKRELLGFITWVDSLTSVCHLDRFEKRSRPPGPARFSSPQIGKPIRVWSKSQGFGTWAVTDTRCGKPHKGGVARVVPPERKKTAESHSRTGKARSDV